MRVRTNFYIEETQAKALKKLSKETRIPQAVFVRDAMKALLEKYRKELKRFGRR